MKKSQRRLKYEKYISSPEWKKKRLERINLDNGECRLCGSTDRLEVHHKWTEGYKNIPNESVKDDLTTLCHDCHQTFHDYINSQRYKEYEIEIQNYQEARESRKELKSYGLENSRIQINGRMPAHSAQWRACQPVESDSETTEINLQETNQDRSRFRGIG